MFLKNRFKAIFIILLSFLGACVSGPIKPVTVSHELPADLSSDYKERFDIKEAGSRTPDSAVDPILIKISHKKKRHGHLRRFSQSHKYSSPKKVGEKIFVYPNRRPKKDPIWVNEQFTYNILYFGLPAGEMVVQVLPFKYMDNRKVYHIKGSAVSSSIFSLFYRLNDVLESFIDYNGFFSHRFHLVLDETKQTRDSLELYDSKKKQTFYWNRWTRKAQGYIETKVYSPIAPFSQDTVSALYYLRTIPLPTGAVITLPIVSEGKILEGVCTVVRREKVDSPLGRVAAIVIKPEIKFQGMLRKNGDSFLWLTDDDRRIPLRLEAKVKIGVVVANLKQVELGKSAEAP